MCCLGNLQARRSELNMLRSAAITSTPRRASGAPSQGELGSGVARRLLAPLIAKLQQALRPRRHRQKGVRVTPARCDTGWIDVHAGQLRLSPLPPATQKQAIGL